MLPLGVPTRGGTAAPAALPARLLAKLPVTPAATAPPLEEAGEPDESERSKMRSFFSMPPVASICGRACGGKATARTMCECCSVWIVSPVCVSQTLLRCVRRCVPTRAFWVLTR